MALAHCPTSFFRSCSQTLTGRQPNDRSLAFTDLSRSLFLVILFFQKSELLFGKVPCVGHPCQKQPSTKTATLAFGNRISGLPGSEWTVLRRNRRPRRNSALRSAISGAVLVRRTRDISRLRDGEVAIDCLFEPRARVKVLPAAGPACP